MVEMIFDLLKRIAHDGRIIEPNLEPGAYERIDDTSELGFIRVRMAQEYEGHLNLVNLKPGVAEKCMVPWEGFVNSC
jgi:hypothetical protein